MSRLCDPKFWTDIRAACAEFEKTHRDVDYSVFEQKESNLLSIELADRKKSLHTHIDVRPEIVPESNEHAMDFWNVILRDLYSGIEKLRKMS